MHFLYAFFQWLSILSSVFMRNVRSACWCQMHCTQGMTVNLSALFTAKTSLLETEIHGTRNGKRYSFCCCKLDLNPSFCSEVRTDIINDFSRTRLVIPVTALYQRAYSDQQTDNLFQKLLTPLQLWHWERSREIFYSCNLVYYNFYYSM